MQTVQSHDFNGTSKHRTTGAPWGILTKSEACSHWPGCCIWCIGSEIEAAETDNVTSLLHLLISQHHQRHTGKIRSLFWWLTGNAAAHHCGQMICFSYLEMQRAHKKKLNKHCVKTTSMQVMSNMSVSVSESASLCLLDHEGKSLMMTERGFRRTVCRLISGSQWENVYLTHNKCLCVCSLQDKYCFFLWIAGNVGGKQLAEENLQF